MRISTSNPRMIQVTKGKYIVTHFLLALYENFSLCSILESLFPQQNFMLCANESKF